MIWPMTWMRVFCKVSSELPLVNASSFAEMPLQGPNQSSLLVDLNM